MRKVLTVALALTLVVSLTGVLTVASDNANAEVLTYEEFKKAYPDLTGKVNQDVDKVVVVSPEAFDKDKLEEKFEDTEYKKVYESEEVVVLVDPIHVGE